MPGRWIIHLEDGLHVEDGLLLEVGSCLEDGLYAWELVYACKRVRLGSSLGGWMMMMMVSIFTAHDSFYLNAQCSTPRTDSSDKLLEVACDPDGVRDIRSK